MQHGSFGVDHDISILRAALRGAEHSVISVHDARILDSTEVLQRYNDLIEPNLLSAMQGILTEKATVQDLLLFLLDAADEHQEDDAVEILVALQRELDPKWYTRHDLGSILLNTTKNNLPAAWMLSAFGTVKEERKREELSPHDWQKGAEDNQSGLNIQAMRDFK